MKQLFTFLIILGCLSCCKSATKSQYETVKENAEFFLKPKLNDPDSYEFVSLTLSNSVLYKDNIESDRQRYLDGIDISQQEVVQEEGFKKEGYTGYDPKREADARAAIVRDKKIIVAIDSIKKALGSKINGVASYTYTYNFRGKNSFGAKVINEYIVQTTTAPKFTVINLTNNPDKVYQEPNGYPGENRIRDIYLSKK